MPFGGIGVNDPCVQAEAREVFGKAGKAAFVAFHGDDGRASGGELCGLAPRSGTKVGDRFAGLCCEEAGGEGGGGVLDPESAFGESREVGNPGTGGEPDGARGETGSVVR